MRSYDLRSFSGTAGATSQWAIYAGTQDPDHEVIVPANELTAQRDATGRVRRLAVGPVDAYLDDEAAFGTGDANEIRLRGGDLRLAGNSLRTMVGTRAPMGGVRVLNDGTTATALTATTLPMVVGTSDFAVACIAEIPSTPAAQGLVTIAFTGMLVAVIRFPTSSGVIGVDHNSGSVDFPAIPTSLVGTVAAVFLERVGTTLTLWINGILVGSVTAASFGASLDSTAYVRFGGAFIASQRGNGVVHRGWMFQHLLTQGDRDFITMRGRLPSELQWAPTNATVWASDFSAGVDGVSASGGTGVGNIDGIGSPSTDDTYRFTVNSSTSIHSLTKTGLLTVGKRYRISGSVNIPSGQANVTACEIQDLGSVALATVTQAATWQTFSRDWTAVGSGLVFYWKSGAAYSYAGNGTDVGYLKGITLQRLGAFLALDFGVGVGNQAVDMSGNGLHATLTTPFEHVVPARFGQVRQRVTASGNTQITAGIPINARITGITANAAGSVTLSVGNASAGTQIVNAQALSTGRQDVTLAGRFSTTGNLWANLSSAVQVDLTVHYEIAD
jgi:hypothetical protein